MRVKITEISKRDSYYRDRKEFIGKIFDIEKIEDWGDGWSKSKDFDHPVLGEVVLFEFKYIEVPEPSTRTRMDDEGRVWFGCIFIQDEKTKECVKEPFAMSELEKLESALSEALRDRDLHAKVADLWQDKLIKANQRIKELEDARTPTSD